jgi:S-DNA-T family DNA segregation ATPase FtsK/SpoIIIE
VWLPPLDSPPSLDGLLPGLSAVPGRGLTQPGYEGAGRLVVPAGLVDKPYEQRREPLWIDFSGAAGHMQILGGPQSGKSTLLRSLICSFALTHTPYEVQVYGLDFGGGGMAAVAGLPHVGGVASRLDPERVRRTVSEVYGVLRRREEYFRSSGIASIADFRARRARGDISVTDQPWGDVFLVIDGWGAFRTEYEGLEAAVLEIASRGLGYGIHLVLTAARSVEVRANLKDHLMNRLELRLGDTMDSEIDRKAAVNVPSGVPGRGLSPQKLHFMAAVPRIDGLTSDTDLADATAALASEVSRHWEAPGAPEVRLLPREFPAEQLPPGSRFPQRGVAFALDENNLEPVFVDFEQDPFFLVFGESESGKSNLLRLLIQQLTQRYSGDEAKFFVVDNRRSLLDVTPSSHLAEYIPMSNAMDHHMAALADLMKRRTPTADVTAQQLRDRSWWHGPTVYVVVDDYDLVSTSSGNPFAGLTELLPFARDVGVRFVIARSTAGAGRASFEAFMQRLTELGAQGVVLAGDPSEGDLLGGVRPRPMPAGRGVFVSRRKGNALVQSGLVHVEY